MIGLRGRPSRIFYVANPGSDSEGSEEDPYKQYNTYPSSSQSYASHPPLLLSQSPHLMYNTKSPPPQYAPTPLTTNLPPDHSHQYQSPRSNPALSSPSSTSSPAVESTPSPSTPGMSAPPVDLSGDGLKARDPNFAHHPVDRADSSQPPNAWSENLPQSLQTTPQPRPSHVRPPPPRPNPVSHFSHVLVLCS